MLERFKNYLIEEGYREYTQSGNLSTVYDYCKRINKVCEEEKCTLDELAFNIDKIVKKYDVGGEKEKSGRTSHNSVINALKRFKEFLGK